MTSATKPGTETSNIITCPNCGKKNRILTSAPGVPRCGNCHQPLPWIVSANDDTFPDIADNATMPVLVDVWAPWCGPCRMVTPLLEALAQEFAGRVKLVKVNADEAPRTSERFLVRGIPTLLVLHHGQEVERQVGAAPAGVLRKWLENSLRELA
jgi:thioredoxin 2